MTCLETFQVSPPGPQPAPFPPAVAAPVLDSFAPLTPLQPDTPVVPTLVVPPRVPDDHMTSPEKQQHERPSAKARPSMPVPQMPVSPTPPSVPPSNHLGGDDQLAVSLPPVVTNTSKPKKPDFEPQEDEEDAGDPDAQPSGHNLPFAEDDDEQETQGSNPAGKTTVCQAVP